MTAVDATIPRRVGASTWGSDPVQASPGPYRRWAGGAWSDSGDVAERHHVMSPSATDEPQRDHTIVTRRPASRRDPIRRISQVGAAASRRRVPTRFRAILVTAHLSWSGFIRLTAANENA